MARSKAHSKVDRTLEDKLGFQVYTRCSASRTMFISDWLPIFNISLRSSAVSRKMQVQAAPTQLPAQIAQRLQFIGPDQNHERLGLLRQELQTIHDPILARC